LFLFYHKQTKIAKNSYHYQNRAIFLYLSRQPAAVNTLKKMRLHPETLHTIPRSFANTLTLSVIYFLNPFIFPSIISKNMVKYLKIHDYSNFAKIKK